MNRLVLALLSFVFCMTAQAQLKRNILGSQLGVSTEEQVKDTMSQRGYEVSSSDKDSFSYKDVMFAGNKCDIVTYGFFNNKLYAVSFVIGQSEYNEIPQNIYNALRSSLARKYSGYKMKITDTECTYKDNKTLIVLSVLKNVYGYAVGLSYGDLNLFGKKYDEELDEL